MSIKALKKATETLVNHMKYGKHENIWYTELGTRFRVIINSKTQLSVRQMSVDVHQSFKKKLQKHW